MSSLPNLLIIGAAKAGTSSLHEYLALHPAIFMSREKELQFFNHPDWRERIDWYREQFPSDAPVRGESSPAYSVDPFVPAVPERARELVPEARIVYLVRDPIARLVAQYVELVALHREDRSLDETLADYDSPSNWLVMGSRYAHQIDRWREHYPDDRVLILEQRALLEEREATLRRAFGFLGVDPEFATPAFDRLHNVRANKLRANAFGVWLHERGVLPWLRNATIRVPDRIREPLKALVADPVPAPTLDPGLRGELAAYLGEDAGRLRAYTGEPYAHWSV